jgi:agmatinase
MADADLFQQELVSQPPFISDATFARTLFIEDADHLQRIQPDVAILGVPLEWGECSAGQSYGPKTIRTLGAYMGGYAHHVELEVSPFEALRVADYGNVPGVTRSDVEGAFDATTCKVRDILKAGAKPLAIGGDHSITYPILRAYSQHYSGRIGLIHFDAHIDVLDKWGCEEYSCASWLRRSIEELPNVNGEHYTMIGARGFWPEKDGVAWMREQGMKVFTMVDVDDRGIDACVERALERAFDGTDAVYLSFDGDALDPSYAPALGMPTPGGLTTREAVRAIRAIMRAGAHGMDLVEMTPYQENEAQTSTYLAVALLQEALCGIALNGSKAG